VKEENMRCYQCGKADLEPHVGIYEYDLARLPYPVLLVGIPMEKCPVCGEEVVTIPDPEGLHRAIALSIIKADRPILPDEVRFLRRVLDKSADDLAALVGIDVKTLSRWENGRQKIGKIADRFLRLLVHRRLAPDVAGFAEELFPTLPDEGEAQAVRLFTSPSGWQRAA
jgi:putative zinc finger/helix-turn-helix YgiT family protein